MFVQGIVHYENREGRLPEPIPGTNRGQSKTNKFHLSRSPNLFQIERVQEISVEVLFW